MVQRAVVVHGAVELVEPGPTAVLGMDETRFGRPRWLPDGHHDDGRIRWVRTDPWETGFVDITGDQALLGQVDGRWVVTLIVGHNLICERTNTLHELPGHVTEMWQAMLPLIATDTWLQGWLRSER